MLQGLPTRSVYELKGSCFLKQETVPWYGAEEAKTDPLLALVLFACSGAVR